MEPFYDSSWPDLEYLPMEEFEGQLARAVEEEELPVLLLGTAEESGMNWSPSKYQMIQQLGGEQPVPAAVCGSAVYDLCACKIICPAWALPGQGGENRRQMTEGREEVREERPAGEGRTGSQTETPAGEDRERPGGDAGRRRREARDAMQIPGDGGEEIPQVLEYFEQRPLLCLYSYIDLKKFGLSNPHFRVYVHQEAGAGRRAGDQGRAHSVLRGSERLLRWREAGLRMQRRWRRWSGRGSRTCSTALGRWCRRSPECWGTAMRQSTAM